MLPTVPSAAGIIRISDSTKPMTVKFLKPLPHLPVKNLRKTLDYYRDHLGFTDEWNYGETDGGIRRDELGLLFAQDEKFTEDINNTHHRLPLMWFVDNIDDIYAEFRERNIEIAASLSTHPYGLREFAFIDINGYYIRVAEAV
jgi:catechol 2,3-dioxygenase-like lactoylglutathione lyase family enzyme